MASQESALTRKEIVFENSSKTKVCPYYNCSYVSEAGAMEVHIKNPHRSTRLQYRSRSNEIPRSETFERPCFLCRSVVATDARDAGEGLVILKQHLSTCHHLLIEANSVYFEGKRLSLKDLQTHPLVGSAAWCSTHTYDDDLLWKEANDIVDDEHGVPLKNEFDYRPYSNITNIFCRRLGMGTVSQGIPALSTSELSMGPQSQEFEDMMWQYYRDSQATFRARLHSVPPMRCPFWHCRFQTKSHADYLKHQYHHDPRLFHHPRLAPCCLCRYVCPPEEMKDHLVQVHYIYLGTDGYHIGAYRFSSTDMVNYAIRGSAMWERNKTEGHVNWVNEYHAPYLMERDVKPGSSGQVTYERWVFKNTTDAEYILEEKGGGAFWKGTDYVNGQMTPEVNMMLQNKIASSRKCRGRVPVVASPYSTIYPRTEPNNGHAAQRSPAPARPQTPVDAGEHHETLPKANQSSGSFPYNDHQTRRFEQEAHGRPMLPPMRERRGSDAPMSQYHDAHGRPMLPPMTERRGSGAPVPQHQEEIYRDRRGSMHASTSGGYHQHMYHAPDGRTMYQPPRADYEPRYDPYGKNTIPPPTNILNQSGATPSGAKISLPGFDRSFGAIMRGEEEAIYRNHRNL